MCVCYVVVLILLCMEIQMEKIAIHRCMLSVADFMLYEKSLPTGASKIISYVQIYICDIDISENIEIPGNEF